MLDVRLKDGHGSGKTLRINGEGEISATIHQHPPTLETITGVPFLQSLTDNGLPTGSGDMRVDGSSTTVEFSLAANPDKDTYVKTVQITIADAGATLNEFGNLTALTNGCSVSWETKDLGVAVIQSLLKTNWDFVKMSRGSPAFGDGAAAFRANNVTGNSEGYVPVIDMAYLFGTPWGLRLRAGTDDRVVLKVNDDITGVDEFTAQCSGMRF